MPGSIGLNTDGNIKGEGCSHAALFYLHGVILELKLLKKNGSITKVSSVEYEQLAILGALYHRFCTIVIGGNDTKLAQLNQLHLSLKPKLKPQLKRKIIIYEKFNKNIYNTINLRVI